MSEENKMDLNPVNTMLSRLFGTQLTPDQEKAFIKWYTQFAKARGWTGEDANPHGDLGRYDMRGWFQNATPDQLQKYLNPENKELHFEDTYKLPGHPTFSTESKYYYPGVEKLTKVVNWKKNKPVTLDTSFS
jgi:hypothetical protein